MSAAINNWMHSEKAMPYHLVCSGRGVKTQDDKCFCDIGFFGTDCSKTETSLSGNQTTHVLWT
jgi:hypothetical protein